MIDEVGREGERNLKKEMHEMDISLQKRHKNFPIQSAASSSSTSKIRSRSDDGDPDTETTIFSGHHEPVRVFKAGVPGMLPAGLLIALFLIAPGICGQAHDSAIKVPQSDNIVIVDGARYKTIAAADLALGSMPGEIWLGRPSGMGTAEAPIAAFTLSANHTLRCKQGGTYWATSITLGQASAIVGQPAAASDSVNLPCIFKQGNDLNREALIVASGRQARIENVTLDGNKARNRRTAGVVSTAYGVEIRSAQIRNFPGDGVQQTSTGTNNQAIGLRVYSSTIMSNGGNGLTCTNSTDLEFTFDNHVELNGGDGIRLINCNSPRIVGLNDISGNSQIGIEATGSSRGNGSLQGKYLTIENNYLASNTMGNIYISGWDGSFGAQVPNAIIVGNQLIGTRTTSNRHDNVHVEDTTDTMIANNQIESLSRNTFRFGVGIFSNHGTEGRDTVNNNVFYGTFGTGLFIGTSATQFCNNDENGVANSQCSNEQYLNNQTLKALDATGTPQAVWVPLDTNNNQVFINGNDGKSFLFQIGHTPTTYFQINPKGVSISNGLTLSFPRLASLSNCSSRSSPAACGSAMAGSVAVAVGSTSVIVNTSAVTEKSQVMVMFDSSLGPRLGVTCNKTFDQPYVSARQATTNFTISVSSAPSTNAACYSYQIIN